MSPRAGLSARPSTTMRRASVVAILLLSVSACGGLQGPMGPGMHGRSAASGDVAAPLPGVPERLIRAGDFWFLPETFTVAVDETVNLVVRNEGRVYHDLTIDALDVTLSIDSGESASGSIRFPTPGTYPFYCSVPGHAEAGMRGDIVVTTSTP